MFKKFLAPLDGSENSERITGEVAALAKSLGSEVVLLAVVDPDETGDFAGIKSEVADRPSDPGGIGSREVAPLVEPELSAVAGPVARGMPAGTAPPGPNVNRQQIVERAVEQARRYLARCADRFKRHDVKVTTSVAVGKPSDEILAEAKRQEADVLALATSRSSSLARGVLGSVTDRVLRESELPTLVMRPDTDARDPSGTDASGPRTVIVPLDGSEQSEIAAPVGIALAKATGANLVFLHATGFATGPTASWPASYQAFEYARGVEEEGTGAEARRYLAPFVDQARADGVNAEPVAYSGGAASRIIDATNELPGSMVVMSTRGRSGIQRWLLGSVTDKVIRSSGRPVLVLPPAYANKQQ
ncbi:MAG: universal stress protein [Dehalococcoidia bacterium]